MKLLKINIRVIIKYYEAILIVNGDNQNNIFYFYIKTKF